MSADYSDPPVDTIVVGGEYVESSVDDDMLSVDDDIELDSESGGEEFHEASEPTMQKDQAPQPTTAATPPTAAVAASTPSSESPLAPSTEAMEDGDGVIAPGAASSPEPSEPEAADADAPVPTKSRSESVSDDNLSSASLSDVSSDSEDSAKSPPQQLPISAPPAAVEEQSSASQSSHEAAASPASQPQAVVAGDHAPDAAASSAQPAGPRQDSGSADKQTGIEIDIDELLNGIQAAASSSSNNARSHGQSLASAPPAVPADGGAPEPVPAPAAAPSVSTDLPSVSSSGFHPPGVALPNIPPKASPPSAQSAPFASLFATSLPQSQSVAAPSPRDGPAGAAPAAPALLREPPTGPRAQKAPRNGPNSRNNQNSHQNNNQINNQSNNQNNHQNNHNNNSLQTFEAYLADEKKLTAEARWEKFPDGSRLFVGNLVQERVQKKDVFNLFHKYGRIAQISLKSAFGFVQYHNAADAAEAIKHLQGHQLAGRKINLETTHTQVKSGKDRDRSPDRNKRGHGDSGGAGGRKDGGFDKGRDAMRNGADGYRPSYDSQGQSRRGDRRDRGSDEFGRTRQGGDRGGGRSRSRSPRPYSRSDDHRQRSPHRSSRGDDRYGNQSNAAGSGRTQHQTLDAQIVMLQEVDPNFRNYVQKAFSDRGLKTDAMFVDPRYVDSLIQHQIADGVLAVVKLDLTGQQAQGKVTIQVFKRVPGAATQVSFDEYRYVDVPVAVELVAQTKVRSSQQQTPTQPPVAAFPPQAPLGYPQGYQQGYPYQMAQQPPPQAAAPALPANLAGLGQLGQLDPALLQKVMAALQGQQQPQLQPQMGAHAISPVSTHAPQFAPPAATADPQQVNIHSILSNLRNSTPGAAPTPPPPASYGGLPGGYGAHPGAQLHHTAGSPVGNANPAVNPQIQSILASLGRLPPR